MSARRIVLAMLAALVVLAGCDSGRMPTFQGWVEAELIFVGPDESGRIETLTVREGDQVELRQLLFTLDTELQAADVAMREAEVKNAQQAYDRATALVKSMSGTQKALDDAEAALRTAQARLNSAQTRLARRKVFSPVAGSVQQIYFRVGEMVPAGKPIVAHPASGQPEGALLRQRSDAAQAQVRRSRVHPLRRLRPGYHRARSASSPARRNSRRR